MSFSWARLAEVPKRFFGFRGGSGSRNDDEGRIALFSASASAEDVSGSIGLPLDTEIPVAFRRPGKSRRWCGRLLMQHNLPWKILGVVLALLTAFYGLRAFIQALRSTDLKPGKLPDFGTSLGCSTASYTYNTTLTDRDQMSYFDVSGDGVGTIIIADGAPDSKGFVYQAIVRSTKKALLDSVTLKRDTQSHQGEYPIRLTTPALKGMNKWHCVRYDVTIFIPPTVTTSVKVLARSLAHVGFAPGATIQNTTSLTVTLQAPDSRNILALSSSAIPWAAHYDAYRGFIDGEASVVNEILLETRLGDGVSNVTFVPSSSSTSRLKLWTIVGSGASNFVYADRKALHRNVVAVHGAGPTADMTLDYRGANINGVVSMLSGTYTLTGARALMDGEGEKWGTTWDGLNWTHSVGDPNGGDFIQAERVKGWTGLYFE